MVKPTKVTNSIRSLRFEHGQMTQADLAKRIGVTRQTVIAIERGRYSPSLEMAFQIAQEHAPDLKLVFNHHSPPGDPYWDQIKEAIGYLRKQGLRVDAVGWQAHVSKGWDTEGNLKKLDELIAWA